MRLIVRNTSLKIWGLIFSIASVLLLVSSCKKLRGCKECQQYDNNKNSIGTIELCGSKLDEAEKDTAHYECKEID